MVDEELEGDWVAERDFDPEPLLFEDDEQASAPAAPLQYGQPNGDSRSFDAWVATNVLPQRQEGFSSAEVKVTRGDLTPEQFRGLAQIMRDFTGGYARTSVQQNLVLRWVRNESPLRRLAPAARSWSSATPARTRSPTSSAARAPTAASSASPAPWASTTAVQERLEQMRDRRSADRADPREDERLPERLQPAPPRQHRLLRRGDEGRRPPDARLHPPPRRQLRRGRRDDGQAAEVTDPGQAGARRGRALGAPLRGEPQRRRAVQRLRRAGRAPRSSRA